MIRVRRRKVSIPTASMSDIAFLLLIFLMVTSLASSQRSVKITLPTVVKADKADVKKRINIYVTKEGRYYMNEKEVTIEILSDKLETQTVFNKNAAVFIYGDADAEYRFVDTVIQKVRSNNLRNCVFVTRQTTENGKNPL